jgi:uncharacterized oxidoreductase
MKLTDNTLLITGGGTGIGLGLAEAFLARDNRVLVCGRRQEKLDQARDALPGLQTYRCDVSDAAERGRLFQAIEADGLRPNVLVNNAACMRRYDLGEPESLDIEALRQDIQTNLAAPIEMVQLFLPVLRQQAGATVINVSSPGGLVPVAEVPIYCASKAALHSFTLSLRHQLAGCVEVIEVYPPSVDTEMMNGVQLDMISLEDFTRDLMRRLAKGDREIWIGQARYLPFMHRLAPGKTFRLVNRSTQFE